MAYHYDIELNGTHYTPIGIVDNNVSVVWDKGDNGLNYRKRLDGSFVLCRSGNGDLYDALVGMTHCDNWLITAQDKNGYPVVTSTFNKRDISYNTDKCSVTIKPRYYDDKSIDGMSEEDYNIINTHIPAQTITYNENYQFEFQDVITIPYFQPTPLSGSPPPPLLYKTFGWTLYWAKSTFLYYEEVDFGNGILLPEYHYTLELIYFREVKLIPAAIDPNKDYPIPIGGSAFYFEYIETVSINGNDYNKYVRRVDNLFWNSSVTNPYITWSLTSYYGLNKIRTLRRARKLNDVLFHFAGVLNCGFSSQFFKDNPSNPISGANLTNIMIAQKSDCIFEEGLEPSDPATLGIITFKELMESLWSMFQVTWVVENHVLYVEHINFFRFNFSYNSNYTPGLDLTTAYPTALIGTNAYSYDKSIPIREKFNFMEAWNIDFIGADIEYTHCLIDGSTVTHSAPLFTTDIDPTYLDNNASKEGFCLFHCDEDNRVISEEGYLSKISSPNAHLSWANLHKNYWRSNRPLPSGSLNNELIGFNFPPQYLKEQVEFEFPFCVENFTDIVNDRIRTTMGDGEVQKAQYSFKTGNIKIKLSYE